MNYGYDDLYRLTSETVASDPGGRNGQVTYSYDSVGNRTQLSSTPAAVPPTGLLNYDANDRTATDSYDANGNLTFNGQQNVYDFENRLVQRGGVTIVYDGDGNRVQETVAGVVTKYLTGEVNPTGYVQVLAELSNTNQLLRGYEWGLQLAAVRDFTVNSGGIFHYYGLDGHGSVRFLTDSTGAVTDTYDYDAFGNLIAQTGTTVNNYLFAGEQFDPALGIYYNRARYYDQRQGRFWTMDTFEGHQQDPASLHRYLYTNADPINLNDPSGASIADYSPYGYAMEARIQPQYILDFAGNAFQFGRPTGLGANPLLKPDIFDWTRKIWMDIKPMSFAGVADAAATWTLYQGNFSPLGYVPDTVWRPTYQNPIGYDGKLFFVVNVQGILFYTCDTSDQRQLNSLKSFADVRQLLRNLSRPNNWFQLSLFSTGAAAGIGAIVNSINQQNLNQLQIDERVAEAETDLAA